MIRFEDIKIMSTDIDYSSLSKEELVKLLSSKKTEKKADVKSESTTSSKNAQETIQQAEDIINVACKYKPVRLGQKPCEGGSVNEYGFCKRHSTTVQARKAKKADIKRLQ